jgi:hypothetical protein
MRVGLIDGYMDAIEGRPSRYEDLARGASERLLASQPVDFEGVSYRAMMLSGRAARANNPWTGATWEALCYPEGKEKAYAARDAAFRKGYAAGSAVRSACLGDPEKLRMLVHDPLRLFEEGMKKAEDAGLGRPFSGDFGVGYRRGALGEPCAREYSDRPLK